MKSIIKISTLLLIVFLSTTTSINAMMKGMVAVRTAENLEQMYPKHTLKNMNVIQSQISEGKGSQLNPIRVDIPVAQLSELIHFYDDLKNNPALLKQYSVRRLSDIQDTANLLQDYVAIKKIEDLLNKRSK